MIGLGSLDNNLAKIISELKALIGNDRPEHFEVDRRINHNYISLIKTEALDLVTTCRYDVNIRATFSFKDVITLLLKSPCPAGPLSAINSSALKEL